MSDGFAFSLASKVERLESEKADLLAALKKWERFARDNYSDGDISWIGETRAAIAKAEGTV